MTIQTTDLPELFYLYCALLYNNNDSVSYSKKTEELKNAVIKILKSQEFPYLMMLDHRYQYLKSLLNSPNYHPTGQARSEHEEMVRYVKSLSEVKELQELLLDWQSALRESLDGYTETIKKVTELFKDSFDFEPKVKEFYITRNWDKSGMMIPTSTKSYIIVGWNNDPKPNVRNLVHEITHAYLAEVDLKIPNDIEAIVSKIPADLTRNYRKNSTIVEESLVRALVVYLSNTNLKIPLQEFSEDDKALQLPEIYLQKLNEDKPKVLSKEYLNKLSI